MWANDRFIEVLQSLTDEVLDQEMISSFSSLRKTALHIWGAEDIWLQRFEEVEKPLWRAIGFEGSARELCDQWVFSSKALADLVVRTTDSGFAHRIHIINIKGEHYDDELGAGLQHVFNHSTYHRGQLVTMLRQAGITTIPGTDLISFVRSGGQ
jgi:uncharacterized damage-inducible protein DinB